MGRREKPQPDRIVGRSTEGRKYRRNVRNKGGLDEGRGGMKDRKTQILNKKGKNERNQENLRKVAGRKQGRRDGKKQRMKDKEKRNKERNT